MCEICQYEKGHARDCPENAEADPWEALVFLKRRRDAENEQRELDVEDVGEVGDHPLY